MENLTGILSKDLIAFLITLALALLLGLEQRVHHYDEPKESLFGTDRTFALLGIAGFVFWKINPYVPGIFLAGNLLTGLLAGIYYLQRTKIQQKFGATSIIAALITFNLAPLVYLYHYWLAVLVSVSVLLLIQAKTELRSLAGKFNDREFIVLSEFLIISAVILPLLPDKIIFPAIPVTPFKFWLAVVAVSGLSYFSYILKKFIFPGNNLILTGILGGLYSSTATTIVLAKKSKDENENPGITASAIVFATGMMFVRIWILAFIFNRQLAYQLLPLLILLTAVDFISGYLLYRKHRSEPASSGEITKTKNPLELKTAFTFALIFVAFTVLTHWIIQHYGVHGIEIFSLFAGITDIDPYLLGIFAGKFDMPDNLLLTATIIAFTSNNLMKWIYVWIFGNKKTGRLVSIPFLILIILALAGISLI